MEAKFFLPAAVLLAFSCALVAGHLQLGTLALALGGLTPKSLLFPSNPPIHPAAAYPVTKTQKQRQPIFEPEVQIPEGVELVCKNVKSGELTFFKAKEDVSPQTSRQSPPAERPIWEIPQTPAPVKESPYNYGVGAIDIRNGKIDY